MQKTPQVRRQLAADRTMMANERTFLAHMRTALHMGVAGLTVIKVFSGSYFVYAGWFLLPAGLTVLIRGYMIRNKVKTDLQNMKALKTASKEEIDTPVAIASAL